MSELFNFLTPISSLNSNELYNNNNPTATPTYPSDNLIPETVQNFQSDVERKSMEATIEGMSHYDNILVYLYYRHF